MKIVLGGQLQNCSTAASKYKLLLKQTPCVTVESMDHIEHIAAYIAWQEVGGSLFIKSPLLPSEQKKILDQKIKEMPIEEDSIIFHTSGTTGVPKTIINSRDDIDTVERLSTFHLNWDKNSSFFNLVPAFTSGFWHIILPSVVKHECKIVLSSKETFKEDFINQDFNLAIFVPGFIDLLQAMKISLPLQKLDMIACGASQVLPKHAEFLFKNGCKTFNHLYGATEIGSPVLGHKSTEMNNLINYLKLTDKAEIINNELVYDGYATSDLFEKEGEYIKFVGRSNDIIKMNGYQCSLLLIENHIEDLGLYGEVLAVPRKRVGADYIELLHTSGEPDKDKIRKHLEPFVPSCNIPLKYTRTESIPKSPLNKKIRTIF